MPTTRRSKNSGSFWHDKKRKRFVVAVSFGTLPSGERDRPTAVVKYRNQVEGAIDRIKQERRDRERTQGPARRGDGTFNQAMLFADLMDEYMRAHIGLADGTTRHRRWVRGLARSLDKIPVAQINRDQVAQLLRREWTRGISSVSCQRVAEFIRAVVYWGRDEKGLFFAPIQWRKVLPAVPDEKPRRIFASEEIAALQASADLDPDFGSFIHVMLAIGARPGELFGAHWTDLTWDTPSNPYGELAIRLQAQPTLAGPRALKPPKWGSARTPDLPPEVMVRLRALRDRQIRLEPGRRRLAGSRWRDLGLIWPSSTGSIVTPSNWQGDTWYPIIARTGVPYRLDHHPCVEPKPVGKKSRHRHCSYVTPYSMRHTSLSQQLNGTADGTMAGSSMKAVMLVSGHKQTRTLERYLHPTNEQISHSRQQVRRIAAMAPKFVVPDADAPTTRRRRAAKHKVPANA